MSLSVASIIAITMAAVVVLLVGVVLIMLCGGEKATNVEAKKEEGKVTLNILVRCARIFQKQDVIGSGDPYVVIKFNGEEKKTVVMKDTREPQWNEEFGFSNAALDSVDGINIELWDEDAQNDEIIGRAVLVDLNQYAEFADGKRHNHTLVMMNDEPAAAAELDVEIWADIEKNEEAGESEKQSETEGESEKQSENENDDEQSENETTRALTVEDEIKIVLTVKGGKIFESHDEGSKDDPFVQLKVGDVTRKSATAINTQNPIWNECFTFEKVKSADADNVSLTLWDSDATQSELIGSAEVALLQYKNKGPSAVTVTLLDDKGTEQAMLEIEVVVEGLVAKSNDDSEVEPKTAQTSRTLSTQHTSATHRTNATQKSSSGSEGKIVLTIRNGKINKAHDEHSKDDPFVEVKIGDMIKKTATLLDTQSPVFDETLTFEKVKSSDADKVTVAMWDADLTQNQLVGNTKLSLLQYKGRGEPTHVMVPLYNEKGVEQAVLEIDVTVDIADVVSRSLEGGSKTSRTNATHHTNATQKTNATHQTSATQHTSSHHSPGHSGGGKVVLTVKNGKILTHHDEHSKDDPFAEIKIGDTIKRTATLLDTQSPVWAETLTFEKVKSSDADKVKVAVWDADATQNQLVGNAKLSLAQYKGKGPAQVSLSLVDDKGVEKGTIELEVLYEDSGATTSRTDTTHHTSGTHHTHHEHSGDTQRESKAGGDVKSRDMKSPGTTRTESSKSPTTGRTKSKSPTTARTESKSPSTARTESKSPSTARTDSKSPSTARTDSKSPSTSRSKAAKGSDTWTEYGRPVDNTGTEVTVVYEGQRKKKKVPKGEMTVDNTNTEWLAYLVNDGRKQDKNKKDEDK